MREHGVATSETELKYVERIHDDEAGNDLQIKCHYGEGRAKIVMTASEALHLAAELIQVIADIRRHKT